MILGSATDRDEETGAHFAILCVREPRCTVYKELAQLLDSIQVTDGLLLNRLGPAPPISFQDLAREAGLEIVSTAEMPDTSKLAPPRPVGAGQPANSRQVR